MFFMTKTKQLSWFNIFNKNKPIYTVQYGIVPKKEKKEKIINKPIYGRAPRNYQLSFIVLLHLLVFSNTLASFFKC